MPERRIWARLLRRYWFVILFGLYMLLAVANRIAPSLFPGWAQPFLTFFERLG